MVNLYILISEKYKKSYVGITNNIDRRLREHNSNKNGYIGKYRPWTVIYIENYDNMQNARLREKFLKGRSGRRFIKKIFDNPNNLSG